MSLCLSVGTAVLSLALQSFSLHWTHSVERIEWSEHWRVTAEGLVIEDASVRGSGAGMEVPQGAVLRNGAWHYRPTLPAQASVSFLDAGRGADWDLCARGECRSIGSLVESAGAGFTMQACQTDPSTLEWPPRNRS